MNEVINIINWYFTVIEFVINTCIVIVKTFIQSIVTGLDNLIKLQMKTDCTFIDVTIINPFN